MTVVVEKLRPVNGSGALRAFASVNVNDGRLKINDLRIVQQDGQRAWVSMPQGSYQKDGKTRYYPIIELSDNLKNLISDAVLRAWAGSGHSREADATPF